MLASAEKEIRKSVRDTINSAFTKLGLRYRFINFIEITEEKVVLTIQLTDSEEKLRLSLTVRKGELTSAFVIYSDFSRQAGFQLSIPEFKDDELAKALSEAFVKNSARYFISTIRNDCVSAAATLFAKLGVYNGSMVGDLEAGELRYIAMHEDVQYQLVIQANPDVRTLSFMFILTVPGYNPAILTLNDIRSTKGITIARRACVIFIKKYR